MIILIPVSIGELVDKITILQIKMQNITDEKKLINVKNELDKLQDALLRLKLPDLTAQIKALYDTNDKLWKVEDNIRLKESKKSFGPGFVDLARSVYILNDKRAAIKREINVLVGSDLIEEKSYEQY
jgi:hypothetical protein